jgi:hypothetical protein
MTPFQSHSYWFCIACLIRRLCCTLPCFQTSMKTRMIITNITGDNCRKQSCKMCVCNPLVAGRARPASSIMRSAVTSVNYLRVIKITQQFRWLGIPPIVIFPLAVSERAHNNGCGHFPYKVGGPCCTEKPNCIRWVFI